MDDGALLGKEVWRERQRPEAWVVAAAVVWTPEQGGCGSRRRAKPAPATRKRDGGADGERSEAEGVRGAKAPKAASRAGEGM